MSEILVKRNEEESIQNPAVEQRIGKTVFESLARPIIIEDVDTQLTGPTQSPTYLGGQFMGIDQDNTQ